MSKFVGAKIHGLDKIVPSKKVRTVHAKKRKMLDIVPIELIDPKDVESYGCLEIDVRYKERGLNLKESIYSVWVRNLYAGEAIWFRDEVTLLFETIGMNMGISNRLFLDTLKECILYLEKEANHAVTAWIDESDELLFME